MPKPKTDRAAVALRPTVELLAEIDAEAQRTGSSRHAEILALIGDGLAARKQPALPLAPAPKAEVSTTEDTGPSVPTDPPKHRAKGPGATPAPSQQPIQFGRSEVLPGSRLKKR